ncbi:hypothetical protein OHC33_003389 [Knufia fluminis]|uniref:Heme oxygenase n=1 Tax=Knufia fluminis TaxID=191047 RepID=A0AAN8EP57_9EURO|nr:hypothetical protein OHC33_003389 [Knufia fluminis]
MVNHAEPPLAVGASPLQSSLHAATRSLHTQLNVSIINRLPQCLPPHTSDPTAYHLGILTFGQIFVALERGINEATSNQLDNSEAGRARQSRILTTLHTPGLARTQSLKHDIDLLSERLSSLKHPRSADQFIHTEKEVKSQADTRTKHITQRILKKPHLALAYTWTMYLALFNGGRHIHRALARAGPDFWLETETGQDQRIEALSFWRFNAATEDNPEADQLKLEFKRKFDEVSEMLTEGEQGEVVREAKGIFELCMELVEYLDGVMADYARQEAQVAASRDVCQRHVESKMWGGVASGFVVPLSRLLNLGWSRPFVEEGKD